MGSSDSSHLYSHRIHYRIRIGETSDHGILQKTKRVVSQPPDRKRSRISEYYRRESRLPLAVGGSADGEGNFDTAGSGKSADPPGDEPFNFSRVALQASAAGLTVGLGLGQGVEPPDAVTTSDRRPGNLAREIGHAGSYGSKHGSTRNCRMGSGSHQQEARDHCKTEQAKHLGCHHSRISPAFNSTRRGRSSGGDVSYLEVV